MRILTGTQGCLTSSHQPQTVLDFIFYVLSSRGQMDITHSLCFHLPLFNQSARLSKAIPGESVYKKSPMQAADLLVLSSKNLAISSR